MAITKLNSLAIPPDTVVESDISFPLDSASFTGDLTVDTDTLVVDSTNNRVGIGVNPTNKLDISGGITVQQAADIKWQNTARNTTYGGVKSTASALSLTWNGSDEVVVNSSGNVGIGSSSPSGKLEVNTGGNAAYFTRTAGDNGTSDPCFGIGTSNADVRVGVSGKLVVKAGAIGTAALSQPDVVTIDTSLRVGIGESNPDSGLEVSHSPASSTNAVATFNQTNTNYRDVIRVTSSSPAHSAWNWLELGTAFTVRGDGNVGIGATSPAAVLDVSKNLDGEKVLAKFQNRQNLSVNTASSISIVADQAEARIRVDRDGVGNSASLVFGTTNAGTLGDRVTIDPSGNLQITDGDLVLASGHGVSFAATGQASLMTSEVLDDYEEGSWTPTISTSSSPTIMRAIYTKVGRQVTASAYVIWTNDQNNNSNLFQIGGLPFTGVLSYNYEAASVGYVGGANMNDMLLIKHQSANYMYIHQNDGTTATLTNSQIHSRGLTVIIFTLVYQLPS